MSEFFKFKTAIQKQFSKMIKNSQTLFLTGVTKDELWETYLESFPPGENEIYKERREYDCNSCRQFLRPYGNIVAIKDNKLVSIWDVKNLEYPFNVVAKNLSKLVKISPIKNVFVSKEAKLGIDKNRQMEENGTVVTWEHFYFKLPKSFVNKDANSVESIQGKFRDSKNVFMRSMEELTLESALTILELVNQGSLYRGEEFKQSIESFITYKNKYIKLKDNEKDNWCWVNSYSNYTSPPYTNNIARIRNSAIGTLLIDLSKEIDLDSAVTKFEKVVAPTNYKRPKAIFTKKMIEEAEKKITELGYNNSLGRRYATTEDITVDNILFANRDAKKKMNSSIFDELKEEATVNPKKFNKVEEVSIDDFVKNILPKATNIELMMENKHRNNLMSLISPQDKGADSMLKWNNNFSWSYNGDITDSMKQNVKSAGGKVDGVLRFSIQWNDGDNNQNDFDAHCIEPEGNLINFNNPRNRYTAGHLDVDIINPENKVAVENITWSDINKMEQGTYKFLVHNYSHNGGRTGFTAEIEYNGEVYSYSYDKELIEKEKVLVAEIKFDRETGIKFVKSLDSTATSKEIWNVNTNKFTKVSICMFSPNYWDKQKGFGNKHYFFILEGCKNEHQPRGFFNEFLKEDLLEHKRVFEALGSKMRVDPSNNQLSGLGFSSTQRNSIIVKVEGSFTRTIKINF